MNIDNDIIVALVTAAGTLLVAFLQGHFFDSRRSIERDLEILQQLKSYNDPATQEVANCLKDDINKRIRNLAEHSLRLAFYNIFAVVFMVGGFFCLFQAMTINTVKWGWVLGAVVCMLLYLLMIFRIAKTSPETLAYWKQQATSDDA